MATQPSTAAPPKEPGRWLPLLFLLLIGCCSVSVLPQAARRASQERVDRAATAGALTAAPERAANAATAEALRIAIAVASEAAAVTQERMDGAGGERAAGSGEAATSSSSLGGSGEPEVVYVVVTATPESENVESDGTARSLSLATVVIPSSSSAPAPGSAEFEALVAYAEQVKPLLETGLRTAERDRVVLDAARDDPTALCGGKGRAHPTLEADEAGMARLAELLEAIDAPAPADVAVHRPLVESARLWSEALAAVNQSCRIEAPIEQGVKRVGAALQLGASLLQFGAAREGFERLFISYGLGALIEGLRR